MTNRKRVNIKAVIADPVLREELVEGATDFICKVEGIRQASPMRRGSGYLNTNQVKATNDLI